MPAPESAEVSAAVEGSAAASHERQVRRQILRGARDCFVRLGITRTSMQDVARAAGVSRGTVYRYFADRETLVREFADWQNRRFRREADARLLAFEQIEEQLAEFAVFMVEYMERGGAAPERAIRINSEIHSLYLDRHGNGMFGGMIDWIAGMLETGRARGQLRPDLDLRLAAEWIARLFVSLASIPGVGFDTGKREELRDFVRSFAVRGLR